MNWHALHGSHRKSGYSFTSIHEKRGEYQDGRTRKSKKSEENQKIVGLIGTYFVMKVMIDCFHRLIVLVLSWITGIQNVRRMF